MMTFEHGDHSDLVGNGEWIHLAVPPGLECPECHEWCPDLLEWIDDHIVRCETCGMEYQPARTAAQKGRRTDDNA